MRKLVSLGLFALFLSVLASPLSADVSDCEDLKTDADAPKGLYGLCIAYYNSVNGKGRDRVEELYERKALAAGYDPEIPGTGGDTVLLDCPCWFADDLFDAVADESGIEKNCGTFADDWGWWDHFDLGLYPDISITFKAGVDYGSSFCSYATDDVTQWPRYEEAGVDGVTEEDIAACRTQLREITFEADVPCSFD